MYAKKVDELAPVYSFDTEKTLSRLVPLDMLLPMKQGVAVWWSERELGPKASATASPAGGQLHALLWSRPDVSWQMLPAGVSSDDGGCRKRGSLMPALISHVT